MDIEELNLQKFKGLYFQVRDRYIADVLNGVDHYDAKENAFSILNYYEYQFFFEQLYQRNLTLYDCLSLTEERLIFS